MYPYGGLKMEHDIIKLQERVALALELGASHFREFKSAMEGTP